MNINPCIASGTGIIQRSCTVSYPVSPEAPDVEDGYDMTPRKANCWTGPHPLRHINLELFSKQNFDISKVGHFEQETRPDFLYRQADQEYLHSDERLWDFHSQQRLESEARRWLLHRHAQQCQLEADR